MKGSFTRVVLITGAVLSALSFIRWRTLGSDDESLGGREHLRVGFLPVT